MDPLTFYTFLKGTRERKLMPVPWKDIRGKMSYVRALARAGEDWQGKTNTLEQCN